MVFCQEAVGEEENEEEEEEKEGEEEDEESDDEEEMVWRRLVLVIRSLLTLHFSQSQQVLTLAIGKQ